MIPNFNTPEELGSLILKLNVVEVGLFYLGDKIKKRPISPNYQGLCPFHKEKTPSFYLKPNKNRYVCYGCGEGGGPLILDYQLGKKIYANIVQKAGLENILSITEGSYLLSASYEIDDNQRRYIQVISEAFDR